MSKKDEKEVNIFDLLEEAPKENIPMKKRSELLDSIGVKDRFKEGNIKIDMRTCRGIECNFCVKVCPTNALYWKAGEIGIEEDLCVYCTACVANCMVDDCITVTRRRQDNKIESFRNPKDVLNIQRTLCSNKRKEKVKSLCYTTDEYFDQQKTNK
ncbi:MAG: 4Fe-4S binding protein [Candidatus Bathyarchaeota archaeon]